MQGFDGLQRFRGSFRLDFRNFRTDFKKFVHQISEVVGLSFRNHLAMRLGQASTVSKGQHSKILVINSLNKKGIQKNICIQALSA